MDLRVFLLVISTFQLSVNIAVAGTRNLGEECWSAGCHKGGHCNPVCGPKAACCRKGYNDPPECLYGCDGFHCCSKKAPPITSASHGWCVKDGNIDQNNGQQVIGSDIPREVCLQRCYAHEKAHGCEWHALRSCSVHKQNVVRGNGNIEYICWAFQRQAPPITTASHGWCVKDGNIDQNDGQQVIGSDIPREVCLQRCYAHEKAHGCEWDIQRSCSVHKQSVVGGNGNTEYICWVFQRQGKCKMSHERTGGCPNYGKVSISTGVYDVHDLTECDEICLENSECVGYVTIGLRCLLVKGKCHDAQQDKRFNYYTKSCSH